MPKAYSYLRFSTPEQKQGHSTQRQQEAALAYAAKRGLELDTELTFADVGVSAFKGKNFHTGQLRAFLRAVEDGLVEQGSYLLVENLDRISRDDAYTALGIVQQILSEGVTLVVLHREREYSEAILKQSPWALMEMLMDFIRANEESATKSKRLKAVWNAKKDRAAASGTPLTSRTPAWLRLDDGEYRLIRHRADVVKRIYADTLQGVGQHRIAEQLNSEGVPVFGKGKHWHRSYVVKVLRNPAVAGVFTPHSIEHEGAKKTRKPGEPVPNYFPAAVDADTFNAVQALMFGGTQSPRRGKHAVAEVQNVFGGLVRCHRCDGNMTRVAKGKKTRPYLVCSKAKVGAGCKYEAIPYHVVEQAFLSQLDELCRDTPKSDAGVQDDLEANETAITEVTDRMRRALRAKPKAGTSSKGLQKLIEGLERELRDLEAERDELSSRAAMTSLAYLKKRVAELRNAVSGADTGTAWRMTANSVLRQMFRAIVLTPSKGDMSFVWKAGRETSLSFFMPDR